MEREKPKYRLRDWAAYFYRLVWAANGAAALCLPAQALLQALLPLAGIYLPKAVLQGLEESWDIRRMAVTVGAITLAMMAVQILEKWLEGRKKAIGHRTIRRLTIEGNRKSSDMDYELYESPSVRELRGRLANLPWAIPGKLDTDQALVKNGIGFLLYGTLLVRLNAWLALVMFALTLPAVCINRIHERYLEKAPDDTWRKIGYMERVANDASAGKDTRIYHMAGRLLRIGEEGIEKYYRFLNGRGIREFVVVGGVGGVCQAARDLLAYAYLIAAFVRGGVTLSDFSLYLGAVTGFSLWVSGIWENVTSIRNMFLWHYSKVYAFLTLADRRNRGPGPKVPSQPAEIRFEHVSYRYEGAERDTIEDLNLTIRPGEKLALVGLNGAGKTTIVKLLTGMYSPSSGRITVDGTDIAAFNRDEYFGMFSAVFQTHLIFPATIEKNVALSQASDRERVRQALTQSGLWEKVASLPRQEQTLLCRDVDDDAVELSGGEFQKLLLARAIYREAPVLVLDEPTAALDPIAEDDMYRKYARLSQGLTGLYVSHRLASTRFCDRILLIQNGKIAEDGTHESLLRLGGEYARLFEMQSKFYREGGGDNEEK